MFAAKNKETSKEALQASRKIKMLEETIDSQNKELIRLRYLSRKSEYLAGQEEELAKLMETYENLCHEVRECKTKYDELNRQLISTMRRYDYQPAKRPKDRRRFL